MTRFKTARLIYSVVFVFIAGGDLLSAGAPQAAGGAKVTAAEALQKLKDGNARFVADRTNVRKFTERRVEAPAGQKPFAVILACADSRVGPELVFDQCLGDLFVVRVAGNVTDPVVLGSIEYAVLNLGSPLIVVMGHENCGAVEAALGGAKNEGNMGAFLKDVRVAAKADGLAASVIVNAKFQAESITQRSTPIAEMVKGERLRIVTCVYSLTTGKVEWLGAGGKKKVTESLQIIPPPPLQEHPSS